MTDFLIAMDQLAAEIAKAAREANTDLDIKIDAFKALVPYYVQKMKKKDDNTDDPDMPTFDNFASNIHATEQTDGADQSGVRGSRRNGS